jgi:hypothetical protein
MESMMYEKCVEAIRAWEERSERAAGKFDLINPMLSSIFTV